MDIDELLRANCEKLWESYRTNLQALRTLQATLIEEVLPNVAEELELDDSESAIEVVAWAREWLEDVSSIFHLMRRNSFTCSFAMESIRKSLIWRVSTLKALLDSSLAFSRPLARCLPPHIRDALGRPIVIVKVTDFDITSCPSFASNPAKAAEDLKFRIFIQMERLRMHLDRLNEINDHTECPVLQYVVLLDLGGLSVQKISIDLFTWIIREVVPRFPGMLAAVFMLNYTWAHSGVWSVIKRILPQSALSRIFFVGEKELLAYFTTSCLPLEFGGAIPLRQLPDPIVPNLPSLSPSSRVSRPCAQPLQPASSKTAYISPTSFLNPFFGYPVTITPPTPLSSLASSSSYAHLRHGRRRKRDLLKTLLALFWMRWKNSIISSTVVILAVMFYVVAGRTKATGRAWLRWIREMRFSS